MSVKSMLRRLAIVSVTSLFAVLLPATMPTAQATQSFCGILWGSMPKAAGTYQSQTVRDVRTGRHECFDRVVVDLRGNTPAGYSVRYVDKVRAEGSGTVVPLRGGAKLEVVVHAPAYDAAGKATYKPANARELRNVSSYSTFRQVAFAGSFEGQTTLGLGVRARLPFRAFVVDDGATSRLVVDVAHYWQI